MRIPVNAPSMVAARELITSAAHRRHEPGLGLADVVDLETSVLDREELIEVIAVLTATIEKMAQPISDVLDAITPDTERGGGCV